MKVATQPASGLPSLRPATTRTRNPASGSNGTRKTTRSTGTSALKPMDVVRRRSRATAVDGHDDPEPDDHFGGGHDKHEKDGGLAGDVVQFPREGHKGEVGGVQH